jgi:SIT4-associating protein SAP185/190
MRAPHPGQDESRRLEVTNADDDGFEEVEPSKEMSEDTSHEFVKAEEDMPPPPLASFLEKDEDEFVDEPLSSPRLTTAGDKIHEQQFEEPDLVVPPLSPTKSKSALLAQKEEAKPADVTKTDDKSGANDDAKTAPSAEPGLSKLSTEDKPSTAEATLLPDTTIPEVERSLSPHPEDKPAPLFAAQTAPQAPTQESQQPQGVESKPSVTDAQPEALPTSQLSTESVQGTTILHPQPEEPLQAAESAPVEPVVGDYLKMQFVEHRVVPTILVRDIFVKSQVLDTNLASPSFSLTHGTTSFTMWSTTLCSKFLTVLWTVDSTPPLPFRCSKQLT